MREPDVNGLFDQFRAGGPLVVAAGAEAARRVHRRRRTRRMLAIAVAVVAIVTIPAVTMTFAGPRQVVDLPVGSPSAGAATPGPEPEPTYLPPEAMLQLADVPAGWSDGGQDLDGDWSYDSMSIYCPQGGDVGRLGGALQVRGQTFVNGSVVGVIERVERYREADATTFFLALRGWVSLCDAGDGMEQAIVDEGFAGEQSVLILSNVRGVQNLHIFVRQGGLIAEVVPGDVTDLDGARTLAERAAARLCHGTTAC
jgi:hypothetical protein